MKKYLGATIPIFVIAMLVLPSFGASVQRLPVPVGTRLVLRLENTISTKSSRVGDHFTATVIDPRSYRRATVYGHISKIDESGRLKGKTELALEFDRIRLRDGRIGRIEAELLEVRQSDSIKVVDEEGNVHSGSRGKQAIKRTSIAAAIGGVIGGLIGGRKGVVIGLIAGAGAGAGSLIIDGKKELRLESGAEMLIRAVRYSGPSERDGRRP